MHPPAGHVAGVRGVPRVAIWNVLLLAAGLVLIAMAAEVWLRLTTPFANGSGYSPHFVPNVGLMSWRPHSEVRTTNRLDYWVVFRTNSLGFADREPISPERAAQSCGSTGSFPWNRDTGRSAGRDACGEFPEWGVPGSRSGCGPRCTYSSGVIAQAPHKWRWWTS